MQTDQNNRFPKQPTFARVSRRLLDVQVEEEISLKLQAHEAHIAQKNPKIQRMSLSTVRCLPARFWGRAVNWKSVICSIFCKLEISSRYWSKNKHIFIVYSTLLNVINGLRVYDELRKVRKSPTRRHSTAAAVALPSIAAINDVFFLWCGSMGLMAMWTIMALQFEPGGLGADYQKLNMIQVGLCT